jgi:VCBS repeat-containing protein
VGLFHGELNEMAYQPMVLTASRAITAADAGADLIMNTAGAALTWTLPAAVGSGYSWRFVVGTVNTSNYLIKVANATDTIDGSVIVNQDGADTVVSFQASGTDDTVTLNGTTTGGVSIGDFVEVWDVAAGQFAVRGLLTGSGTEATPFSATVS